MKDFQKVSVDEEFVRIAIAFFLGILIGVWAQYRPTDKNMAQPAAESRATTSETPIPDDRR